MVPANFQAPLCTVNISEVPFLLDHSLDLVWFGHTLHWNTSYSIHNVTHSRVKVPVWSLLSNLTSYWNTQPCCVLLFLFSICVFVLCVSRHVFRSLLIPSFKWSENLCVKLLLFVINLQVFKQDHVSAKNKTCWTGLI